MNYPEDRCQYWVSHDPDGSDCIRRHCTYRSIWRPDASGKNGVVECGKLPNSYLMTVSTASSIRSFSFAKQPPDLASMEPSRGFCKEAIAFLRKRSNALVLGHSARGTSLIHRQQKRSSLTVHALVLIPEFPILGGSSCRHAPQTHICVSIVIHRTIIISTFVYML